jgi:hypothetical protein
VQQSLSLAHFSPFLCLSPQVGLFEEVGERDIVGDADADGLALGDAELVGAAEVVGWLVGDLVLWGRLSIFGPWGLLSILGRTLCFWNLLALATCLDSRKDTNT